MLNFLTYIIYTVIQVVSTLSNTDLAFWGASNSNVGAQISVLGEVQNDRERSLSFTFTRIQCSGSGEGVEGSGVGVITMYML